MSKAKTTAELRNNIFGESDDYVIRSFIVSGGVAVFRATDSTFMFGRGDKKTYLITTVSVNDPKVDVESLPYDHDGLVNAARYLKAVPLVAYGRDYCKKVKFVCVETKKTVHSFE